MIITRIASERGIKIELKVEVTAVNTVGEEDYLVSKDGRKFLFHEAIWCTEVCSAYWFDIAKYVMTMKNSTSVTPFQ